MSEKPARIATVYDLFVLLFTILSLVVAFMAYRGGLDNELGANFWRLDLIFSLIFMADFLYRGWHSADKRDYLRHNWVDFLGSLPAVPALRVFRLFRVWRLIRVLQRNNVDQFWRSIVRERAKSSLWGMIIVVILSVLVAGSWIQSLEQAACAVDERANICSLEDGMWWAFVTVTTVGYGDQFPVSNAGRIMAAVLMTVGVGLFGVLTSYLASIFVEAEEEARDDELQLIREELAEIKALLKQQMQESST